MPHWEICKSEKSTAWRQPQGAGKNTCVARDETSTYKDSKLGWLPFQCHWPRKWVPFLSHGTHFHHIKGVIFGLWPKELFSNDARVAWRRGSTRKVQVWIRIMPKSKVREEPTVRRKPEVFCLTTSPSWLHLTQDRVSKASKGSNWHIHHVPKTLKGYFPD